MAIPGDRKGLGVRGPGAIPVGLIEMAPGDVIEGLSSGEGDQASRGRVYGGLTVAERRAVRRGRLIDAGLDLFAVTGYASTTIEAICARAGVTARHFYEEFGSREELLKAVFDQSIDTTTLEVIEALSALAIDPNDLDALVRAGVAAFIHAFLDDPRGARVVCIESVGVSPDMELHRRNLVHGFARLLQSEVARTTERGPVKRDDFALTTRAVVGGTNELIVDWLLDSPRPSLEVLIDVVANLYLAVITYG